MRQSGFTLVELLVAVTIFAIISAVAIPAYTQYTERGFRTELTGDLMACAQALERFNAINFTYVGVVDSDGDGVPNPGVADGDISPTVCTPNSADRYDIDVQTTVDTFVLTADPADDNAMADTGVITLNQAGIRTWDEDDDGNVGVHESDWNEG